MVITEQFAHFRKFVKNGIKFANNNKKCDHSVPLPTSVGFRFLVWFVSILAWYYFVLVYVNTSGSTTENKQLEDVHLSTAITKGIHDYGIEVLTSHQIDIIHRILRGESIQSGTGATTALIIAMLQKTNCTKFNQILMIFPTRELARQAERRFAALGEFIPINTYALVGGINWRESLKIVENRQKNIILSTPGRLFDTIQRGLISMKEVTLVVIDELEELLMRGFNEQLQDLKAYDVNSQWVVTTTPLTSQMPFELPKFVDKTQI